MPPTKKEDQIKKVEEIMKDHISSTNLKWHSNVFTSSSITKIVLKILGAPKTKFRIFHKIVRDIFKEWEEKSYCEHIQTTHYAHCKKTKMIVQFSKHGFIHLVPEVFPLPI